MGKLLRGILAGVLLAVAAAPAAADAPEARDFARMAKDAAGAPRALQTAIVRYAPAGGGRDLTVDLIGAVHVADAAYYAALNDRFAGYDALLFEMIVPGEEEGAPGGEGGGLAVISTLQNGMKNALGLSYQLHEIDYAAPNFVHADLSTHGLRERMQDRNESLYVYFWRLVFASLDEYAKDPLGMRDWRLIAAMMQGPESDALKIAVAGELLTSLQAGDVFGGPEGSALIAARNEHAIGVLREQIDAGARRIGIFYGVAHMPDFDRRLRELDLVRTGTEWVDAWRFGQASTAPAGGSGQNAASNPTRK